MSEEQTPFPRPESEQAKAHPWPTLKAEARAVWLDTGLTPSQLAEQRAELLEALEEAERFMAGFEGDELQDGIGERLSKMRAAIAKARGGAA